MTHIFIVWYDRKIISLQMLIKKAHSCYGEIETIFSYIFPLFKSNTSD